MARLRRQVHLMRLVAIVAGGTFLGACVSWQTQPLQPERFQTADSTQTLRLVLTSGDTIVVRGPVITGDSVVGLQARPDSAARRVVVPLTAIRRSEIEKEDSAPVVLGVVGIGALIVALVAASNTCYAFCSGH
jgi:hypothetical protein